MLRSSKSLEVVTVVAAETSDEQAGLGGVGIYPMAEKVELEKKRQHENSTRNSIQGGDEVHICVHVCNASRPT